MPAGVKRRGAASPYRYAMSRTFARLPPPAGGWPALLSVYDALLPCDDSSWGQRRRHPMPSYLYGMRREYDSFPICRRYQYVEVPGTKPEISNAAHREDVTRLPSVATSMAICQTSFSYASQRPPPIAASAARGCDTPQMAAARLERGLTLSVTYVMYARRRR